MSVEDEDGSSATQVYEAVYESQKKRKVMYARDFLLSLSELEICKKLPSGFDQSLLSEFEDASHGLQDHPRVYGSFPLRRNNGSSSPPTRGDSTRGVYGRWDNRGSGWNDKDNDSPSDLDADSGRHTYGNPSRQSWQNSEHDGLLGSGSFPRAAGYAAGTSAPKGQTNKQYQLNRSNLPDYPPRPFKAVPYSRTSTSDLFNDETFGSSECTSQDKAEEERKRRASFELMRKEQQKVLQEKQKFIDKHKSDCFSGLMLEETKELLETNGELDFANLSISSNDSGKPSYPSQSFTSRPLVPPGFRSMLLETNPTAKPLISSTEKEGNPDQKGPLDNQGNIRSVDILDTMEQYPKEESGLGLKMGEAIMSSSSGVKVPTEKIGMNDHHLCRISGLPALHEAVAGEVIEFTINKVMGNKIVNNPSQDGMPSILGKLSDSAPTIKNYGSSGSNKHESKPDDSLGTLDAQSAKFAQWFHKDEKKPLDNLSFGKTNDLISLIVDGEKAQPQVPNTISTKHTLEELSCKALDHTKNITSSIPSDSKHLDHNYRQEAASRVAAVLTCEDLEQAILSEYSEKSSIWQPPVPEWSICGQGNMDAKAVDNHATHNLLSILQKGTSIKDAIPTNINIGPSEKRRPSNIIVGVNSTFDNTKDAAAESLSNAGPNLTPRVDVTKVLKQAGDGTEIQLPEEENLFMVGHSVKPKNIMLAFDENTTKGELLPSDATFDVTGKLAGLNSGFRGGGSMAAQEGPCFVRGPYDLLDPDRQFNRLHSQASSPQLQAAQMTHNQTMFHPLDPHPVHINAQMRFPEHLRQYDTPNHQFPSNMFRPPFHHPDTRVTGFNIPLHPQMQMRGNFPHHLLREVPRSSPVPPHPRSQATNFMPNVEAMHGFIGHRQPNIGGLGMPLPASDPSGGTSHPEAFQRIMEMELQAQAKQIRPFGAVHNQGMYGHELDMVFNTDRRAYHSM